MKVAVLQGLSENSVLTGFSEQLALAFADLGHSTVKYDLRNEVKESAREILQSSYDLIISFNAMLSGFQVDNNAEPTSLAKAVGSSFLAWFVDDTLYHANRILALPQEATILTPSKSHELFVRKLGNRSPIHQLLAGTTINHDDYKSSFEERDFDVLVAGSWMGAPEPFWEEIKDPSLSSLFEELARSLESSAIPNVFESVLRELGNNGIKDVDLVELYPHLIELHLYVRRWNRLSTVKKITKYTSLKIAVVGTGWETSLRGYDNVIHLDPVCHENIKKLYRTSRFIICPNTENGACERIFDALEVGAIPIAEKCKNLSENPSLGDFIIFHDAHSDADSEYLFEQVNNCRNYELIGRHAQAHVREHETWLNRAHEILLKSARA